MPRILTTHAGSLPREGGAVRDAVRTVVRKQRGTGLDLINDGEQGRRHYATYIRERLTGFADESVPYPLPRDQREFPEFEAYLRSRGVNRPGGPPCTGPIGWRDFAAVGRDIENLKTAAGGSEAVFMSSVSPGQAARIMKNRYYASEEEYLRALAAVLKDEYHAIVEAGFILQIDCPDLAAGWNNLPDDVGLDDFRRTVELHVRILNEATRELPPERMRVHVCWGNYEGPHNHDIDVREILELVLEARPSGLSLEGANPRHAHEWRVFREVRWPSGKHLIPGVIDTTTNFIEHPQLVAERICRYADAVGRANVIAGTDCGFASTGSSTVLPSIAWAKLAVLVEGARLASQELS
jgi:5-methyltetrahydropteroyltriglutamate--homocysteine methyltransferase